MAKKKAAKKSPAKRPVKKKVKNSLVGNINQRKKAGKSRRKSESTISDQEYGKMKKGWKK